MLGLNLSLERLAKFKSHDFYVSISHIESHKNIADATDDKGQRKREAMSNLQQATVKLILDALHSSNLTIESFVIMAISLSRSFPACKA